MMKSHESPGHVHTTHHIIYLGIPCYSNYLIAKYNEGLRRELDYYDGNIQPVIEII